MRLKGSGKRAADRTAPAEPSPTVPTGDGVLGRGSREASAAVATATSPEPPAAPPRNGWKPLGELLVEHRSVSHAQLAEVLLQQSSSGKPLGTLLVETGLLQESALAEALAEQFSLPMADLRREDPEPDAPKALSESVARGLVAMPLGVCDDGSIEVAIADPRDHVRREVAQAVGKPVTFVVATAGDIRRTIDRSYRALGHIDGLVAQFKATEQGRAKQPAARAADAPVTAEDAPVVQVVNMIITQALRDRASDIHIEPQDDRVRVRYRIDGALHDVLAAARLDMAPALASRIKIMAGMNIVERRRPQDGQIAHGRSTGRERRHPGRRPRPSSAARRSCMRLLDKIAAAVPRSPTSACPPTPTRRYSKLIHSPYGMVICAGPTGSGQDHHALRRRSARSTSRERNIMTIEDPVEYVFPSINQIQINEQAGITFAAGLQVDPAPGPRRHPGRRDPRRRDRPHRRAVRAHRPLRAVLAARHRRRRRPAPAPRHGHRVVPGRLVGHRRRRPAPGPPHLHRTAWSRTSRRRRSSPSTRSRAAGARHGFCTAPGCNFCAHTGYLDRIGVYELLRVTPEIKRLDRRPGHPGRDPPAGRLPGHAHPAGRGRAPRRARRHDRSPRSCAPSTPSEDLSMTDTPADPRAAVVAALRQRRPHGRRPASAGERRRRRRARGSGEAEEELLQFEITKREGHAQGPDALLPADGGVHPRRPPDPRGGRRHHRGDGQQALQADPAADGGVTACGGRHSPTRRPSTRTRFPTSTAASCGRPS